MLPNETPETVEADTAPSVVLSGEARQGIRTDTSSTDDLVVVMPTRVRIDSRVVLVHCTTSWLSNFALNILILAKLPLHFLQFYYRESFLLKQLGPPPPENSSPGLQFQYSVLKATRMRTFVIDVVNACLEGIGLWFSKGLFVQDLERVWTKGETWGSFRMTFSPVWGTWLLITTISCMKNRHERVVGGARDLLFLFLLFVAFKLDQQSTYSWRLVFLIPWMWFSAMFLLTCMVFVLLVFARAWTRITELILPLGFFTLLLSCIPQFVSYIALVDRLDGNTEVSNGSILIPNALSWILMWFSSLVVCWGLYQKEELRANLQASGAVWTANEQIARQAQQTVEAAQRRIDDLNEDEIATLVQEMMEGKTKPGQLMKTGGALFRRISAGLGANLAPVDNTSPRDKQAEGLLANEAMHMEVTGATIGTAIQDDVHCEAVTPSCNEGSSTPVRSTIVKMPDMDDKQGTSEADGDDSMTVVPLDNPSHPLTISSRQSEAASDDGFCIICYDNAATCVFLECGHGGYCRKCANRLFVRPPNECPTCRQKIDQVGCIVELYAESHEARPCLIDQL